MPCSESLHDVYNSTFQTVPNPELLYFVKQYLSVSYFILSPSVKVEWLYTLFAQIPQTSAQHNYTAHINK